MPPPDPTKATVWELLNKTHPRTTLLVKWTALHLNGLITEKSRVENLITAVKDGKFANVRNVSLAHCRFKNASQYAELLLAMGNGCPEIEHLDVSYPPLLRRHDEKWVMDDLMWILLSRKWETFRVLSMHGVSGALDGILPVIQSGMVPSLDRVGLRNTYMTTADAKALGQLIGKDRCMGFWEADLDGDLYPTFARARAKAFKAAGGLPHTERPAEA